MSIETIENKRTQKQKELVQAQNDYFQVEAEKLAIQRAIIKLQMDKKDLDIILNKSSTTIKNLKVEIAMLTNEFWSNKNG